MKDQRFLSYVRQFGCLVCGQPSQAHHLKFTELAGMARKVSDYNTVPLCFRCHEALHKFGDEQTWWDLQGINPMKWATEARVSYERVR